MQTTSEFRTEVLAHLRDESTPQAQLARAKKNHALITKMPTTAQQIPDGYAATLRRAATVVTDANGIPDGYATALGRKEVVATNGIPDGYATATPRTATVFTNGIPDGYATALARREAQRED